jgi:hypothetical protein
MATSKSLSWPCLRALILAFIFLMGSTRPLVAAASKSGTPNFPPSLESYDEPPETPLVDVLRHRIQVEPLNLIATAIFFLAIAHTFLAPKFLRLSHFFERRHQERLAASRKPTVPGREREEVSFLAVACHFLGEIEVIFGIWVVPLMLIITFLKGWPVARDYLGGGLNFTEPLFVVVIMTIAASRPILQFSEKLMALCASLGGGSLVAWWFSILTIGPILGSFITEPAAMTISALLLYERFYRRNPSPVFAYATLGLLFVNVSVGGTLTHFAAPPVLMVADKWGLNMSYMFMHFGGKVVIGMVVANLLYLFLFRREFKKMAETAPTPADKSVKAPKDVPVWVVAVHIIFLAWTVLNSHFPALFIGGFLFYLAFTQATEHHQSELVLKPALLVGFFLAGLVIHGGLQGWWIAPVLSGLKEVPLFLGAATLTAFNDNAAITYLASLVPGFSEHLQYAVLAGAVAGGGLTVIANAPNPAGQAILSKFFPQGISPLGLLLGALAPTIIVSVDFLLFR